jgi:hypothetical protein
VREYDFPTVGDILTGSVQETLGSSLGNVEAINTDALIRELDRINRQFIRAAHTKHDNKGWSWMEEVYDFQTKNATALAEDVAVGETEIDVDDGTDFSSTGGKFYVLTSKGKVKFITYTTKASDTITCTASTVNITLDDGNYAELLYDLPSDFAKEKDLIINTGPGYEYQKYRGVLPSGRNYTVYNGSILLPKNIGEQDCTLVYDKKARNLNTGDGEEDQLLEMNIPTDFIRYATESLNAYIFMKRKRREDAQISLQLAEQTLIDALSYDINSALNGGLRASW